MLRVIKVVRLPESVSMTEEELEVVRNFNTENKPLYLMLSRFDEKESTAEILSKGRYNIDCADTYMVEFIDSFRQGGNCFNFDLTGIEYDKIID